MDLPRRRFLQAAAAALAAATAPAWPGAPRGGASGVAPRAPVLARLALLQTRSRAVSRHRPADDLRRNLQHMLDWIERAQADGPPHDWLAFHECPLTGWERWTEAEAHRIALDLDGPALQRLGERARAHRCHLSFGALLRLPDWPGRVIDATVFLGRDGAVSSVQWAPLAPRGLAARAGVTTLADVLDEYVERYGRGELVRLAHTDLGRLCAAPTAADPELTHVLAQAGADFVLRTHAGALTPWCHEAAHQCARARVPGGLVNAAVATDLPGFADSPTGGGTALLDRDGRTLARAADGRERWIGAELTLG